jgi:hypothetical protein
VRQGDTARPSCHIASLHPLPLSLPISRYFFFSTSDSNQHTWQASPSNPWKHWHTPFAVSHLPRAEHSAMACASVALTATMPVVVDGSRRVGGLDRSAAVQRRAVQGRCYVGRQGSGQVVVGS